MKKIAPNVYSINEDNVDDFDCCIYLVNTLSEQGLVLIDSGIKIESIINIKKKGFNSKDINHCFLTHCHLDHFGACNSLKDLNENIKFYAHDLDANAIEKKGHDEETAALYANVDYKPVKLERKFKGEIENFKFGRYTFQCIHIPGHTPGSIAILLELNKLKILFGGDICGSPLEKLGGNLENYKKSMQKLLNLKADILCEGHMGVIKKGSKVSDYIRGCLEMCEYVHTVLEVDPSNIQIWYDLCLKQFELKIYDSALDSCKYLLEIDPNNTKAKKLLKKIKKHKPQEFEFVKNYINEYFGDKDERNS